MGAFILGIQWAEVTISRKHLVKDTSSWHLVFSNDSSRLFECTSDSYLKGLLFLRLLHNVSACISTRICKWGSTY